MNKLDKIKDEATIRRWLIGGIVLFVFLLLFARQNDDNSEGYRGSFSPQLAPTLRPTEYGRFKTLDPETLTALLFKKEDLPAERWSSPKRHRQIDDTFHRTQEGPRTYEDKITASIERVKVRRGCAGPKLYQSVRAYDSAESAIAQFKIEWEFEKLRQDRGIFSLLNAFRPTGINYEPHYQLAMLGCDDTPDISFACKLVAQHGSYVIELRFDESYSWADVEHRDEFPLGTPEFLKDVSVAFAAVEARILAAVAITDLS